MYLMLDWNLELQEISRFIWKVNCGVFTAQKLVNRKSFITPLGRSRVALCASGKLIPIPQKSECKNFSALILLYAVTWRLHSSNYCDELEFIEWGRHLINATSHMPILSFDLASCYGVLHLQARKFGLLNPRDWLPIG